MAYKETELDAIKAISKRFVDAQRQIRILDSIKWDESIQLDFFAHRAQRLPAVTEDYYKDRPLPFKPREKQEELGTIIRDTQNQFGQYSPLTRIIRRQCDEYIRAVDMLLCRGKPIFSEIAINLYGGPDDVFYSGGPRLSEIGTALFNILTSLDIQLHTEKNIKRHTAVDAQKVLQERLGTFFNKDNHPVNVVISDGMVADASAGADTIKLSEKALFSDRDIRYLEVHEGWVHVGTTINGSLQPYCYFLSKGSPACSVIQEGLAVITELVSLSSYPGRVRKIINRVVALDKIKQGANFLDIYRYFLECGLSDEESYKNSVRVFRGSLPTGGGFTRDLSYAKGFVLIYNFILFAISQHRLDLIPLLFSGKLALDDLPFLSELKKNEALTDPIYLPPPFQDLSALSAWMSFSLFLNKFNFDEIQKNFQFLLT